MHTNMYPQNYGDGAVMLSPCLSCWLVQVFIFSSISNLKLCKHRLSLSDMKRILLAGKLLPFITFYLCLDNYFEQPFRAKLHLMACIIFHYWLSIRFTNCSWNQAQYCSEKCCINKRVLCLWPLLVLTLILHRAQTICLNSWQICL